MSASGIIIFRSHCNCTGQDHISVYVTPGTCEDDYHRHHIHNQDGEEVPVTGGECHECAAHTKECGCKDLNISYFKLKNEVVYQKVRPVIIQYVKVLMPEQTVVLFPVNCDELPETDFYYIEPPSFKTSLDFLIPINQLKIPYFV